MRPFFSSPKKSIVVVVVSGQTHGRLPSAATLLIGLPRLLHRAKPSVVNQLETNLDRRDGGALSGAGAAALG